MDELEVSSFGVLLKRFRTEAGLTQAQLAERAGLSGDAVSTLERGARRRPHRDTARLLADALQLTPRERTIFENAAQRAPESVYQREHVPPPGSFLGAMPQGPLVGCREEMSRIDILLDAVMDGAGNFLLLAGELGTGKTRLAQEAMAQAHGRGFLVATGRCYQQDHHSAFRPVLEALTECSASAPPGQRAGIERQWRSLQESVDTAVAGSSPSLAVAHERALLFAAIADFVKDVAGSAPIAILIDDVHWADEGTLDLLQALARATRGVRVLLLATFRDVRLSEEHPTLVRALQDLSRERLVERIAIRRLSAEETATLAAAMMGRESISDDVAAFIFRRTRGVPRLVDQMVRSFGGRLQLQEEIGAGAMGRVFRAFDTRTQRLVAAKIMLGRTELDLDALHRFQHEAAVLTTLEHPNIVRIDDSFVEEHACCIIMELLEGRSLREVLLDGPLPLGRVKYLALQVVDALSYAHGHDIAHRDIKPDNIMVLKGDRVKVTDFGIARILQRDTSLQTFATTGMRIGTPLYMAPEQVEGKKIDGRTDIYALGALLFHMTTGRPPFEGSDALAVAVKHLQEEPQPPSSIDPSVPAEWDAVILKSLAKDPEHRYQTAREMRAVIEALSSERASSPASMSLDRGTSRSRLKSIRFLALAIASLIATLAIVALVQRGQSSGTHASSATPSCVPAYVDFFRNYGTNIAYKGFVRAASRLRVSNPHVYDGSLTSDYYAELSRIAQRHPCIVTVVDLADAGILTNVSRRYPSVNFALIDNTTYDNNGPVTLPNVAEWTMPSQQSGYLVGYLAGLMEKNSVGKAVHGVIGVMGGVSVPQVDAFIHGYEQGAHAAYPAIKVLTDYSGNFADQQRARVIGLNQISRGADILFGVAGDASLGYLDAAKKRGKYANGVDEDRSYLGPYVLTSALKHYDNVVYSAVMQAARNHFKGGEHRTGLAEGGVGITNPSRIVPASIAAAVRARAQKIALGEIAVQP